jgi:type IV pilus assembly protein PilC
MLAAGIPLRQSFHIIGKGHENPSMQVLLLAIKANIENGDTLAEALKKNLFILTSCSVIWFMQVNMLGY